MAHLLCSIVWGGIDTLVVSAAVMTLRPLYELSGLDIQGCKFTPQQVDKAGIERVVETANQAVKSNYIGPLIIFTVFVSCRVSHHYSPDSLRETR